jgi:integrase
MTLGVQLASNGDYWQACWRDSAGNRRRVSIGPKTQYSKRAAQAECNRIAAEHAVQPQRRDLRQAPSLQDWCTRYLEIRTDLTDSTKVLQGKTFEYLRAFFPPMAPIDKISRTAAAEWRAWLAKQPARLAKGETDDPKKKPRMSEATVCQHVRTAKVLFRFAVDQDLIAANPFSKLRGSPPHVDADFEIIDRKAFERVLEACPSPAWRTLLALCRLAGLRRGEALRLRWCDVDLAECTITVLPKADDAGRRKETTKQKRREVPIEPRLAKILQEAWELAEVGGSPLVAPVGLNNLDRDAWTIIQKAKLPPYSKPFHTLRKNLETEWLDQHPVMTVCKWLGHAPTVAARHYQKPTAESMAKVTGKAGEDPRDARIRELEEQLARAGGNPVRSPA